MRYFSKAIPSRQLSTPRGVPVQFEIIDDRQAGLLATEDGYIISELLNSIANRRGGISEVTELEYHDFLKKKQALASLPQPTQRGLHGQLLQAKAQRRSQDGPVAAVANPPVPHIEKPPRVEIKTEFPRLGRWRDPTTA